MNKTSVKRRCVICGRFFTPGKGIKYKCAACANLAYIENLSEKKRHCSVCGKIFEVRGGLRYFCSEDCKNGRKGNKAEGVTEKRRKQQNKMSAAEIARMAREEGLNYGQYVAKHGL